MPRPRKWKNVHALPGNERFGPIDCMQEEREPVEMLVEEYETIRLIDREGLTQSQAAERMDVSRATIQRLYGDARTKLAEALIKGRTLVIRGGDFQLCGERMHRSGEGRGRRHRHGRRREDE